MQVTEPIAEELQRFELVLAGATFERFLVVTECGLSDRLAMEVPDKTFVKGCKLCTFMKVTSLEDVRDSLKHMRYEIEVPEEIRVPAERALLRMFDATDGGTLRSEVIRK